MEQRTKQLITNVEPTVFDAFQKLCAGKSVSSYLRELVIADLADKGALSDKEWVKLI